MERSRETCLDRKSQKKTYFTNINMLKGKPANEYHQMLPYFTGVCESKQNTFDFESAREFLMKDGFKMVVKRHFERICNKMECKSYMNKENILKTKR